MFRTCIYCHRSLGANQLVESFPVGRRLAFDQEKGRLWVVCDRCRRWNLSPLDERWEAIEECEKRFRDTSNRFSTENIGVARLSEGLELVRIGRPQRPEFAAWRYGKQFLKRRVTSFVKMGARAAAWSAMAYSGFFIFIFFADDDKQVVARPRTEDGRKLVVTLKDAKRSRLVRAPETADGWVLSLPHHPREGNFLMYRHGKGKTEFEEMEGPSAIRAAARILPRVNSAGGSGSQVRDAVRLIEETGAPDRVFGWAARAPGKTARITKMSAEVRLALEMAAHEETERRAFEGELAELEMAWREAEEIASIADRLLIPRSVEAWIERQRRQVERMLR